MYLVVRSHTVFKKSQNYYYYCYYFVVYLLLFFSLVKTLFSFLQNLYFYILLLGPFFFQKPKCFKRVLSLAETVGAWTTESLGATKVGNFMFIWL